ncbi:GNAT family N-acetyltransferase [Roseomonas sp. KE2513]|uniref:GNAT family N-acetyltransferase n=1 Tax=Roseomonas sp. KE2513 TaxID=2479202 RepID=UPI002815C1F3|nr:GNAT family N-acetyltransferase [Roseomonas sp. KE2513]
MPTEALTTAGLTPADMAGCLALSEGAGWNQSAEDWSIFFRHGTVVGIEEGGRLVASGAVLPYPSGGFGWVSMVLVAAAMRGRGLGTRILHRCIEALRQDGLCPVLDATPAGERIYRPLGFRTQFGLTRWRGLGGGDVPPGIHALRADVPAALDVAAFGADRHFLMAELLGRAPANAFALDNGFVLARPGRAALQIGPLVAESEAGAARLLDAALAAAQGPVLLDLADRWTGLAAHLRARGLAPERPYNRMALDRAEPFGDPARLFIVAGPELG